MNVKLPEDIKMITLPEDRVIGEMTIKKDYPLPILVGSEINLDSITAGLIKIIAWCPTIDGFDYYKNLLSSLSPNIGDKLNLAGVAQSKKEDLQFAEELFLALNHLTSYPESYLNLAQVYYKKKEKLEEEDVTLSESLDDKIYHCLLECTEKHPKFAAGFSELSNYHLKQNNKEEAINTIEKFLELSDDENEKSKFKKVLNELKNETTKQNDMLLAYDKIMMGCSDEAVTLLNKLIEADKTSWELFFLRGWAKRILNAYSEAEEDLMEGLKLNRKSPEIYNELSICARELKKSQLGISYLEIALDLEPNNLIYLTNLAFLHLEDKDYDKAAPLLVKARQIDYQDEQLISMIKQYENLSGTKLNDTISEDIVSKETIEQIKKNNPEVKEI